MSSDIFHIFVDLKLPVHDSQNNNGDNDTSSNTNNHIIIRNISSNNNDNGTTTSNYNNSHNDNNSNNTNVPGLSLSSTSIVAFIDDLTVTYTNVRPDLHHSLEIHIVSLQTSPELEFTSSGLQSSNSSSGQSVFPCSVFDRAGHFEVRLLHGRNVTKEQSPMIETRQSFVVVWPKVTIRTDLKRYTALTNDVTVKIFEEDKLEYKCHPRLQGSPDFVLLLEYVKPDFSSDIRINDINSDWSDWLDSQPISSSHVAYLPKLFTGKDISITISCRLIDRSGIYRLSIRTLGKRDVITTSEYFRVIWSDEYMIHSLDGDMFPCIGGIRVDVG